MRSNFEKILEKCGGGEFPAEEMAKELMTDMTKADKTTLPGIYSEEFEYSLSSIFVEANTEQVRLYIPLIETFFRGMQAHCTTF